MIVLLLLLFSLSIMSSSMASTSTSSASLLADNKQGDASTTADAGPLLLEAPPSSVDEVTHKLDLSKGPASISLGPLVVNEDGTLSRVQNWDTMTQSEKDTTTRVLTRRNVARLERLKELEKEGKLPGQLKDKEEDGKEQRSEREL